MTSTARTYTALRHSARAGLLVVLLAALVSVAGLARSENAFAVVAPGTSTATPTTSNATSTSVTAGNGAGKGAGTGAGVNISINGGKGEGPKATTAVQLLVLLTVLALAPSVLIMMTGFTRILIVMGFIRNALGTPTMPPNQVLIGLSLFLTLFVMQPTFEKVNETALKPYSEKQITQEVAIDRAQKPLREFMFRQVNDDDLALFVQLAEMKRPDTRADIPTHVLIPAFLISELKTAFQIGFLIFIPFLVIDMVVASTLMSMGMIMLPPVMISLPFKILLFVLVDGWHLTIESLVVGFR